MFIYHFEFSIKIYRLAYEEVMTSSMCFNDNTNFFVYSERAFLRTAYVEIDMGVNK